MIFTGGKMSVRGGIPPVTLGYIKLTNLQVVCSSLSISCSIQEIYIYMYMVLF